VLSRGSRAVSNVAHCADLGSSFIPGSLEATMRIRFLLAAGMLSTSLVACGGSDSSPTAQATPIPTPTPPQPQVVSQGTGVSICKNCASWFYYSVKAGGTAAVTLDYSFPDSLMYLWTTPGRCSFEMSDAGQCVWTRIQAAGKPSRSTIVLGAGDQTLVIDNRGPHDETVSFQVVLTPSTASAAQSRPAVGDSVQLGYGPPAPQPALH
jgi:hypothetical protein